MRASYYTMLRVQKLMRFTVYSAYAVLCVRGTEGRDSAEFSCKIPRATLVEDENCPHVRREKVQKHTVLAQRQREVLRRTLRKREGAWPDLDSVQKYCVLQVKKRLANEALP